MLINGFASCHTWPDLSTSWQWGSTWPEIGQTQPELRTYQNQICLRDCYKQIRKDQRCGTQPNFHLGLGLQPKKQLCKAKMWSRRCPEPQLEKRWLRRQLPLSNSTKHLFNWNEEKVKILFTGPSKKRSQYVAPNWRNSKLSNLLCLKLKPKKSGYGSAKQPKCLL